MNQIKKLIIIGMIAIAAIAAVHNPLTKQYVNKWKQRSVTASAQKSSLWKTIEANASKHYIPPSDAKVDRVWKAIPGYNGLAVDVEASYKKMKSERKYDDRKLVFKQISPKVHLSDLPPSPIYRGHPDKPMVSFLINVAWGNEFIPDMLATLKKHDVFVTFFLEGRWVKANPDLAKMIADSGHELGNHSYTHPDMKTLSREQIREQLIKTNQVIEATTGKQVRWFGPPSGSYRDEVVAVAHSLQLGTVMWTVDTIDWQKPSPEVIINSVTTKVSPGAMILMHPTASTSAALDQLIKSMKQKNLRIGTVSKLMREERIMNKR
ncbi:polysaccharide deacetylase family protein [Bacillus chungangensis]|uniref:Sporulation protein (Polysaccharide deacetylase family) n=1 Tax=Bacillus chungangensis TaxID=587633 RepID=A0ABT9WRJ6_9BACI|nr:polysaccharide deacetylase family protein [Bacillus chungangensis]MDQ0175773.1 putative sporulation protein (polysaccharide deacetylase family) [Bacillus chungangensis]